MVDKPRIDGGLRELALFAGAGGGIIGGRLLGWRTVCAVECEPYPASVLCARQNDGLLAPFPVWDDVRTFDGKPWRGIVDVVSGGFPCQDISAAGKGTGITGARSGLWKEMARIIGEVRPRFVFVENSPMLVTRGLGTVLGDLAEMGFDAEWGVLSAADVGAPHLRERCWIVAHANSDSDFRSFGKCDGIPERIPEFNRSPDLSAGESCRASNYERGNSLREHVETNDVADSDARQCDRKKQTICTRRNSIDLGNKDVADTLRNRPQRQRPDGNFAGQAGLCGGARCDEKQCLCNAASKGFPQRPNEPMGRPGQIAQLERPDWWKTEPNVSRMVDELAARVDRLKAIGNGQVPLCAATAFRLLRERLR